MASSIAACQWFPLGFLSGRHWSCIRRRQRKELRSLRKDSVQEDVENLKLHMWFVRLACFSARFLSLHWGTIPYLTSFRWRFSFGVLGCIYKKLCILYWSVHIPWGYGSCVSTLWLLGICAFFSSSNFLSIHKTYWWLEIWVKCKLLSIHLSASFLCHQLGLFFHF